MLGLNMKRKRRQAIEDLGFYTTQTENTDLHVKIIDKKTQRDNNMAVICRFGGAD